MKAFFGLYFIVISINISNLNWQNSLELTGQTNINKMVQIDRDICRIVFLCGKANGVSPYNILLGQILH